MHVTGTFDNWTKSVRLEKVGDVFEKEVELPPLSEKVYYKVRDATSVSICPSVSVLVITYNLVQFSQLPRLPLVSNETSVCSRVCSVWDV